MRAIVGVDAHGAYRPALCLFAALDFPGSQVTLLHTADPTMPFQEPLGPDAEAQAEFTKVVQNLGLTALEEAASSACSNGLDTHKRLVFGSPSHMLIAEAENTHAELVVVCATHTGKWSTSFLGSVSRALTISCPASILVAKGPQEKSSNLKAVFATDHSVYADRCVEKFIQMAPKGLSEVIVLTAFDIDDREAEVLHKNLPMLGGFVDTYVEEKTLEKSAKVVEKLTKAGFNATSKVIRGNTTDAIRTTMQESEADLLVLGAQGHGFLERLMVGSISLHQVVSEPYPVMVLRA